MADGNSHTIELEHLHSGVSWPSRSHAEPVRNSGLHMLAMSISLIKGHCTMNLKTRLSKVLGRHSKSMKCKACDGCHSKNAADVNNYERPMKAKSRCADVM